MKDIGDEKEIVDLFLKCNDFICFFGDKPSLSNKISFRSYIVCNNFEIIDFKNYSVKIFSYMDDDNEESISAISIYDNMKFVGKEDIYRYGKNYIQYSFILIESNREFIVWIRG